MRSERRTRSSMWSVVAAVAALLCMAPPGALAYDLYIYPDPDDGSQGGIVAPANVWTLADQLANLPVVLPGPQVMVTAVPTNGYHFDYWEVVQGASTVTILTNSSSPILRDNGAPVVELRAHFSLWKLDIVIVGDGSVDLDPAGGQYPDGTVVTLTAIPHTENFIRWSTGVSNIFGNPTQCYMDTNKVVTCYFGTMAADADSDGLPNDWEVKFGLNPQDGSGVNGAFGDPDNDGLSNEQEWWCSYVAVTNSFVEASPINADSDGDGMDDGYEFYHIAPGTNLLGGTNAMAVVSTTGFFGRNGNPDMDYKWNTLTGYETVVGLINYEEYVGPDLIVPGAWSNAIVVPGISLPVYAYEANTNDTADQSFSDVKDSEMVGGDISGDGFDDGYEYSWDLWQAVHGGDPVGDPLGHRVPDRFGTPGLPLSVTIGDWNHDNTPDLAVAVSGHDEVTTLYGRGGGTFNVVTNTYAVEDLPRMISSGDLDGDGQADDLAVCNGGGNSVSVLIETNGIHQPATHYPVGLNPSCLALGNFTGGAETDIAVANEDSDNVMILDGGLNFAVVQTIGVGDAPSSIAAGPVFSGIAAAGAALDLAVANFNDDTVSILQNVAGVFGVFGTVAVGDGPTSVELRDIDNDGTNDLVVSCYNSNDVRGYKGNGDGTFGTATITFLGDGIGPRNIAVGHLDPQSPPAGNTNLDVVVANELVNTVGILIGMGGPVGFSVLTTIDVGNWPCWVELADLNGDQLLDIVVVQRDSDCVRILLAVDGAGTFMALGEFDVSYRITDRRFSPGDVHVLMPDFGKPDYDLCYNTDSGGVGDWLSAELEYNAWSVTNQSWITSWMFVSNNWVVNTNGSLLRPEYPSRRRGTHPFLWDVDRDQLPDGWELAFGYDPWDRDTDDDGDHDGEEDPEGDWYATGFERDWLYNTGEIVSTNVTYLHHDLYAINHFDPRVGYGWMDPGSGPDRAGGPDTKEFSNYQELIGPRQMAAIQPQDPYDTATHPYRNDTDGDTIWDGWEWYVGLNAKDQTDGPKDNNPGDGDGLFNYEEFLSYNTSTNIWADRSVLTNWANKSHPCDPFDRDTDADQTTDGAEREMFNYMGASGTVTRTFVTMEGGAILPGDPTNNAVLRDTLYQGGGLNPTTADTDGDYLPDYWETSYPGSGVNPDGTPAGDGMDGTFADAVEDTDIPEPAAQGQYYADCDGDGLANYQEYMIGSIYHWQWLFNNGDPGWFSGGGFGSYDPWDFFSDWFSRTPSEPWGSAMVGPGGRRPKFWDPHYWANKLAGVPYNFLTAAEPPVGAWLFSTGNPQDPDSDWDGMDDYWEVYHMLNPIRGDTALPAGIDLVFGKVIGGLVTGPFMGYDIRATPWVNGEQVTDWDQDGLANIYESVQPECPPGRYYHTDPSSYWLSDISDWNSWANKYYWCGNFMGFLGWWFWDPAVMAMNSPPYIAPNYMFSFEMNEGFETDNDLYPDRAELVDTDASPGATDPIDSEDPIRHRAVHLDGVTSACRTYFGHTHAWYQFRSFAVECWVKSENPKMGRDQVIVERPALVPNGNPLGYPSGIRLNFRIALDRDGRVSVGYHGHGFDPIFEEAKVPPEQAFLSNSWYHVAGVYDAYEKELRMYVNGKLAAMKPTAEIPWNGWYSGYPDNPDIPQPISFWPMPIVVGAAENDPAAWVDGFSLVKHIWWLPFIPYAGLNLGAPRLPQLDRYFQGWVDEVRIWDGPRSQSAIQQNRKSNFTRKDVINANTFPSMTPDGQYPISLVYCYGFDDLQDPDHEGVAPEGFDLLTLGEFPSTYPGAEWWYTLPPGLRCEAYNDYRYVPWIENLSCHMPFNPPRDTPIPWDSVANNYINTLNPYVFEYRTGINMATEFNPRYNVWNVAPAGSWTNLPIYGDLLPIGWAVADQDEKLWEEDGKYGPFDFDGDGLPDDWETAMGLDPRDSTGENGPDGDPDSDGLSNLYEYLTHNESHSQDTDGDGQIDTLEDFDGDGLYNLAELMQGTMPHMVDTDDDGVTDWEEVTGSTDWTYDATRPPTSMAPKRQSDPLDPIDPIIQRCAYFGTAGNTRIIVPPQDKFMTFDWTVEMWVRPAAGSDGGVLLSRYVPGLLPGEEGVNYEIGLATNSAPGNLRLYARFMTKEGVEYRVDGTGPTEHTAGLALPQVPYDQWTHVAGTFASDSNTMSIYVNAKLCAYRYDASGVPPTVLGYFDERWNDEVTIGALRSSGPVTNGYEGYLDEVRIWRTARSAQEILDLYNGVSVGTGAGAETAGPRYEELAPALKTQVDATLAAAQQKAAADGNSYSVAYSPVLTRPLNQLCGRLTNPLLAPTPDPNNVKKAPVVGVPSSWDWRSEGGVTPIKDQGQCGSCWAFASTAPLESGILIGSHTEVDLSEQYLVSCNLDGYGCSGGLCSFKYYVSTASQDGKFGGVWETDFPYAAADLPCGGPYERPYVGDGWSYVGASDFDHPADEDIKRAIYKYGPVYAGVFVGPAFQAYAGGIFNTDESAMSPGYGNHAITLVGWDDAGGYWIMKNQWGAGWGEAGYMRIGYGISLIGEGAAYISVPGGGSVGGIAAEFRFDDGGLTAQDFTVIADWMENWRHACAFDGVVFATNTVPPLDKDTDGDGMPDWWEISYDLDPQDATGVNGAYGDPDTDELDNLYEYLAGTDPRLGDSDGNGFGDYDSMTAAAMASGVGRTFGEIFDDEDRIPDLWEIQYPGPAPETGNRGLDPAYYDAHLDPDEDGWSNYAEFMWGSDPLWGTNYPTPNIVVHARYNGLLGPDIVNAMAGGALLHIEMYTTPPMDGYPVGTLDIATNEFTTNVLTYGHLVEGPIYIFGYLDVNGDGQWQPDTEPAGLAEPFPVQIGWGDAYEIEIGLRDSVSMNGYPRFSWAPPTSAGAVGDGYEIRMMRGSTELFRRWIRGSARTYVHEGDYLYQGRYGLGAGNYACNVFFKEQLYGLIYTNYLTTVVKIVNGVTLPPPTIVTANDYTYQYEKNDVIWSPGLGATAFTLDVAASSGGPALATLTRIIPYRDNTGKSRTALPFYAGDTYAPGLTWANGPYWLTMRTSTPTPLISSNSVRRVQVLLRDPVAGGKSKIKGSIYYFGKTYHGYPAQMPGYPSDLVIIIQSFTSPGFSGAPDGQVQLTATCSTNNYGYKGDYDLRGLHNGTHYVRAFLDLNGNRALDGFEPFGFYQEYTGAFEYDAKPVDLATEGSVERVGIRVVIRDRDTDDDALPDGWEWMYYGTLDNGSETLGLNGFTLLQNYEMSPADLDPTRTDYDNDGLSDMLEVTYSDWSRGLTPDATQYNPYHPILNPYGVDLDATRSDTDCDGLLDKYEVDNGLNPLSARGDADNDGMTDAYEVLYAHTSPVNAADVLSVKTLAATPSGAEDIAFSFQWEGRAGVTYRVQYRNDMIVGGWADASDGVRSGAGTHTYVDLSPPAVGRRFYRVTIVP